MVTTRLYNVQQSPICVPVAPWHNLGIDVNTDIFTRMGMVVVRGHQIPIIFPGPTWWALVGSRDHHLGATWSDVTDSTRCIMLMKTTSSKAVEWCLVLGAVYCCSTLPSSLVLVKNGFVGETDVVGATTYMIVIPTAHRACSKGKGQDQMTRATENMWMSVVAVVREASRGRTENGIWLCFHWKKDPFLLPGLGITRKREMGLKIEKQINCEKGFKNWAGNRQTDIYLEFYTINSISTTISK